MLDALFVTLMQAAMGQPAEAPQAEQPVAEQAQEATQEAPGAERVRERNRRRCRVENVTGSRLGARVCQSQSEEEMLEREGRGFLEDHMRMWFEG